VTEGALGSRATLTELGMRPEPKANSYNLTAVVDIARDRAEPCPIARGEQEYDPVRSLFVRIRDCMRLCETRTTDFSLEELAAVKDRYGQIYADISVKLAPDDFEADLRKLHEASECLTCQARGRRCGGCWQPRADDVIARHRRHIDRILGWMNGRILDIGCGAGAPLAPIAQSVAARQVDYVGIDPDPGHIALLASRHPWARYRVASAEELLGDRAELGTFDHVVLLRSYNHLRNPGAALDAAIAFLDPGGTLLIVDNVAFGLVRSPRQASMAEAGSAVFEHFRNEDSAAVEHRLADSALRLIDKREVTPDGSNEWFLHYEKTGDTR
jgi:SAM-dependent methyltransferase